MSITKQQKSDKEKFPLRIDRHTVIMVTEDKCNEEYAMRMRTKYSKSFGRVGIKDLSY